MHTQERADRDRENIQSEIRVWSKRLPNSYFSGMSVFLKRTSKTNSNTPMTFVTSARIMVSSCQVFLFYFSTSSNMENIKTIYFKFFLGVPYDCDSIMHFGTETFSLGRPTMEARDSSCDLRWIQWSYGQSWQLPTGGWALLLMVGMALL